MQRICKFVQNYPELPYPFVGLPTSGRAKTGVTAYYSFMFARKASYPVECSTELQLLAMAIAFFFASAAYSAWQVNALIVNSSYITILVLRHRAWGQGYACSVQFTGGSQLVAY